MNKILKQFLNFIVISGVGFLMDFFVYYILTEYIGFPISYANMVSAVPAVTYVFFLSTRKIFRTSTNSKLKLKYKYLFYLMYQIVLVSIISLFAQKIYDSFYNYSFEFELIKNNLKILIKCFITPITMTCNFIFMKILSEKI